MENPPQNWIDKTDFVSAFGGDLDQDNVQFTKSEAIAGVQAEDSQLAINYLQKNPAESLEFLITHAKYLGEF